MKNIIKKMFSLILVGMVAVSMLEFIEPNRIQAAGEEAEIEIHIDKFSFYECPFEGHYDLLFFNNKGKLVGAVHKYVGATKRVLKDERFLFNKNTTIKFEAVIPMGFKSKWLKRNEFTKVNFTAKSFNSLDKRVSKEPVIKVVLGNDGAHLDHDQDFSLVEGFCSEHVKI